MTKSTKKTVRKPAKTAPYPVEKGISMQDLEQETAKFMSPQTEKEKAILEAALELLGERGVERTTTAEIARKAGVTEKTLFRYFPTKLALVRRVLFPVLLRSGLKQSWETFDTLLTSETSDLRRWYVGFSKDRMGAIARHPELARTITLEIANNDEMRRAITPLWQQHIFGPMLQGLRDLQASGAVRKDIDVETLARIAHCMNIGYVLVRHHFAPDRDWDDAAEIQKMADILEHGASAKPMPGR
jgi:TetR/AcrR family transcriptional regulator